MKRETIADICCILIIPMFLYASFSKYFDWAGFHRAMFNQPFSHGLAWILIFTVPPLEIIASILLMTKWRRLGFALSAILMFLFTGYIALILLNFFPRVPCSCGGIIRALTWNQHLIFNIFFLLLSIIGWACDGKITNKTIPALAAG
jgi:hypothetical protein